VRCERCSIAVLAAPPAAVAEKFGNEIARLPWFQNIRAIWSHRTRLERLVVMQSEQSARRFETFRELIECSVANAPEFSGRRIDIIASDSAVDFGKAGAVHDALTRALRQARSFSAPPEARPAWLPTRGSRYRDHDITIDVTSGTKPFSIAAVVSTLGPDGRFLYVGNDGVTQMFNASLRLADGVH
jgi:hypothetical protein